MILEIYAMFLLVSISLLFFGWYVDYDFIKILASVLFFILAIMIMPGANSLTGDVEYRIATNKTIIYQYGDNYTGEHWSYNSPIPTCPPNNLDCVNVFHTIIYEEDVYDSFESKTLGFYLSLLAVFNFIGVMVDRRNKKKE